MGLDNKIKITKIIRFILITMAVIYFIVWFIYWLLPKYYALLRLEQLFGFIPSIFNKIFIKKLDLGYRQIPMGYLYASIFNILFGSIFCNRFIEKFKAEKILEKEKEEEEKEKRKHIIEERVKKQEERKKTRQTQYKDTFFGLFELDLEFFDSFGKDTNELKILKFEYYKIIVQKLKPQFREIDFIIKDKIFFLSSNFSLIEPVTKDILKILNIIINTNKDSKIRTNILFSYWLDDKTVNKMGIFRALNQINDLGNKNKIIILNDIYLKTQMLTNKPWFKADSIGSYNLFKVYGDDNVKTDLSAITRIY